MTSLANAGVEGHIISRNKSNFPRKEKLADNLYVHRVTVCPKSAFRRILNFPAFFSPFWVFSTLSIVKSTSCKLIIVRDLPLSPMALWVGKVAGVPVIMDMAENYPAMIRDTWHFRGPRVMDFAIRNPDMLKLLERVVVPKMDGVIVVSEYSAKRVRNLGVKAEKIWIVGNTPKKKTVREASPPEIGKKLRHISNFIVLYVGGMEESRGLDTAIVAMSKIVNQIPDALLLIVGDGATRQPLEFLAKKLGITKNVKFTGWVKPEVVPDIISVCDIGLVPHYVTEHTDTTLPNKLFDYMAHGKPVIATNSRSLKDIILSCKCGRIYDDKSPEALARVLLELRDPHIREKLGQAGLKAFLTKYNWEKEEEELMRVIHNFCEK